MGVDYYGVLKVPKTASADDCRKAYRRLAMKWHPDNNHHHVEDKADKDRGRRHRFDLISEAYEVLCDAQKRLLYDEVGEEGLKNNHGFHARNALEVFKEAFGFDSPNVMVEDFEGALNKVFKSALEVTSTPDIQNKGPPVQRKLICSLEELYNGSMRKVKVSKNELDANGRTIPTEETLTIEIKPGWRAGTRVTFLGKGGKALNMLASDVVFIIEEKPHHLMKRKGDDLVIVKPIALVDALTGYVAEVTTLDGRVLRVPCMDVLRPGSEVLVKNEGMPIPFDDDLRTSSNASNHVEATKNCTHDLVVLESTLKDKKKKGDLRLHFEIIFPIQLTARQKHAIRHALIELK